MRGLRLGGSNPMYKCVYFVKKIVARHYKASDSYFFIFIFLFFLNFLVSSRHEFVGWVIGFLAARIRDGTATAPKVYFYSSLKILFVVV